MACGWTVKVVFLGTCSDDLKYVDFLLLWQTDFFCVAISSGLQSLSIMNEHYV